MKKLFKIFESRQNVAKVKVETTGSFKTKSMTRTKTEKVEDDNDEVEDDNVDVKDGNVHVEEDENDHKVWKRNFDKVEDDESDDLNVNIVKRLDDDDEHVRMKQEYEIGCEDDERPEGQVQPVVGPQGSVSQASISVKFSKGNQKPKSYCHQNIKKTKFSKEGGYKYGELSNLSNISLCVHGTIGRDTEIISPTEILISTAGMQDSCVRPVGESAGSEGGQGLHTGRGGDRSADRRQ